MEWMISITSELSELETVQRYLDRILVEQDLADEFIRESQLIAEEIISNIIRHGYGNQSEHSIDFWIRMDMTALTMIFVDSAKPFNPLIDAVAPNLSVSGSDIPMGGVGVHLVRELSDYISYNYRDEKNCLTVSQHLPQKL